MTIKLTGVSGSLRRGSWNSRLLNAARQRMPERSELVIGSIADIPPYNFDIEDEQGFPDAVLALNAQVAEADGLLLVTPEYNNSIPGVLKNAIDWLSRPVDGTPHVFRDKVVTIIGATPGGFGTQLSQAAWLPVMRTLGTRFWSGDRLPLSKAPSLFDDAGELQDKDTDARLRKFLAGFVDYARANR